MKTYVIDTVGATDGPWRVSEWGNKYANVTLADGRKVHVAVEKGKRIRIPYKPRGHNIGWQWHGTVRLTETNGRLRIVFCDRVNGSCGVRGLLRSAGLIPAKESEVQS